MRSYAKAAPLLAWPSVGSLQTAMSSVCGTMGSMLDRSITIPGYTVEIGGFTYTTFPQRSISLFPAAWNVSC